MFPDILLKKNNFVTITLQSRPAHEACPLYEQHVLTVIWRVKGTHTLPSVGVRWNLFLALWALALFYLHYYAIPVAWFCLSWLFLVPAIGFCRFLFSLFLLCPHKVTLWQVFFSVSYDFCLHCFFLTVFFIIIPWWNNNVVVHRTCFLITLAVVGRYVMWIRLDKERILLLLLLFICVPQSICA